MTNFDKPHDASTPTPGPATGGDAGVGGPSDAPPPYDRQQDDPQAGAATPDRRSPAGFDDRGKVKRGRVSTLWISLIAAAVVLILLIIFIAQNLDKATIHFLGLSGRMPIGLTILIAAIFGILIAAIPGTIRIIQLRKSLKRNTPKDERTV